MKKNIMADYSVLTISRILTIAISMAYSMILVRVFTKIEYATYSQALLIITITISVFGLTLAAGINYFLAKTNDIKERLNILAQFIWINTITGIIAMVTILFLQNKIVAFFGNNSLYRIIFIIAILPGVQNFIALLPNIFIVINESKIVAIYNIVVSVAHLVNIVLCYLFHFSVQTFMLNFLGINILNAIVVFF